jgi:hypothetical protein
MVDSCACVGFLHEYTAKTNEKPFLWQYFFYFSLLKRKKKESRIAH